MKLRSIAVAALFALVLACGVKGAPRAPRVDPVTPPPAPAAQSPEEKPTSVVQPPPVEPAPETGASPSPATDAGITAP